MTAAKAMADRRWEGIHAHLKPMNWSLINDGESIFVSLSDENPAVDIFEERLDELAKGAPDENDPEPTP